MLFRWFRQLCVCIDQYHRCRNWREYRYLNPYSVIVSEEGELLLLDLEAQENAFAMKQMQKRAVREHFVKPVCRIEVGKSQKADLFAYGKTIQFLLAYTEVVPALTRREEVRLSRVIARCMGESGKAYEDIAQVLKVLPEAKERTMGPENGKSKKLLAVVCGCVSSCALLLLGLNLTATGRSAGGGEILGGVRAEYERPWQIAVSGIPVWEKLTVEDIRAAVRRILNEQALSETENEIRAGMEMGREIELDTVRCLSEMYEKLDMPEEAADAYGRLIQIETEAEQIEAAGLKKMELEASQAEYMRAVATGEAVLEKIKDSEAITSLTEEYREKAAAESKPETNNAL